MTGAFVTGTDTGVGKTFVTSALARRAREFGQRVFAFKPIETGCCNGLGDDQRALTAAAGGWQTGELAGLYSFKLAAAPLVSATAEGGEVSLERITHVAHVGSSQVDFCLVEGAGGWRVPITRSQDMSTLARALALPVVVVARAGLGTINHSLLTIEAVERDGLKVAALVLSRLATDDESFARSNAEQIRAAWAGTVFVFRDETSSLDAVLAAIRST
jgi:dethiobiotin synthetase